MKEITLKLTDPVAEFVSRDAKEMGLTSEELIRYLVGSYVQEEARTRQYKTFPGSSGIIGIISKGLPEFLSGRGLPEFLKGIDKDMMKIRAREGSLSCRNCTMKLTESDVEAGECGSCHAPLFDKKSGMEE